MQSPIPHAASGLARQEILLSNFLITVKNPFLSIRFSGSRAFVIKRVASHIFDLLCNQSHKQHICEVIFITGLCFACEKLHSKTFRQ